MPKSLERLFGVEEESLVPLLGNHRQHLGKVFEGDIYELFEALICSENPRSLWAIGIFLRSVDKDTLSGLFRSEVNDATYVEMLFFLQEGQSSISELAGDKLTALLPSYIRIGLEEYLKLSPESRFPNESVANGGLRGLFHLASASGNLILVQELLNSGADNNTAPFVVKNLTNNMDYRPYGDKTPLEIARDNRQWSCMMEFLGRMTSENQQSILNTYDSNGKTFFQRCVELGIPLIYIRKLLELGANIRLDTKEGLNVIALARQVAPQQEEGYIRDLEILYDAALLGSPGGLSLLRAKLTNNIAAELRQLAVPYTEACLAQYRRLPERDKLNAGEELKEVLFLVARVAHPEARRCAEGLMKIGVNPESRLPRYGNRTAIEIAEENHNWPVVVQMILQGKHPKRAEEVLSTCQNGLTLFQRIAVGLATDPNPNNVWILFELSTLGKDGGVNVELLLEKTRGDNPRDVVALVGGQPQCDEKYLWILKILSMIAQTQKGVRRIDRANDLGQTLLYRVVTDGDPLGSELMQRVLALKPNLCHRCKEGKTALQVLEEQMSNCRAAAIDASDKDKRYKALEAMHKMLQIPTLLAQIEAGERDVNDREPGGDTLLHVVARNKAPLQNVAAIQALRKLGADPLAVDSAGRMPWQLEGEETTLLALKTWATIARLRNGKVNVADVDNIGLLHNLVQRNHRLAFELIAELLELGANPLKTNAEGRKPRDLVPANGDQTSQALCHLLQIEERLYLVRTGVQGIETPDHEGNQLVHWVAFAKLGSLSQRYMKVIFDEYGADPCARNLQPTQEPLTPLEVAKRHGQHPDIIAELEIRVVLANIAREGDQEAKQALANKPDGAQNCPLHKVAALKHPKSAEWAQMLLDAGADVSSCNGNGESPFDVAKKCKNDEVIKTLQRPTAVLALREGFFYRAFPTAGVATAVHLANLGFDWCNVPGARLFLASLLEQLRVHGNFASQLFSNREERKTYKNIINALYFGGAFANGGPLQVVKALVASKILEQIPDSLDLSERLLTIAAVLAAINTNFLSSHSREAFLGAEIPDKYLNHYPDYLSAQALGYEFFVAMTRPSDLRVGLELPVQPYLAAVTNTAFTLGLVHYAAKIAQEVGQKRLLKGQDPEMEALKLALLQMTAIVWANCAALRIIPEFPLDGSRQLIDPRIMLPAATVAAGTAVAAYKLNHELFPFAKAIMGWAFGVLVASHMTRPTINQMPKESDLVGNILDLLCYGPFMLGAAYQAAKIAPVLAPHVPECVSNTAGRVGQEVSTRLVNPLLERFRAAQEWLKEGWSDFADS